MTALVARNIETLMAQKGLNAAEVARRLGSNPTIIYDILSGKSKNPRLDTLQKIATTGLGVPVSVLLFSDTESDLDKELLAAFSAIPEAERRRVLAMLHAYIDRREAD